MELPKFDTKYCGQENKMSHRGIKFQVERNTQWEWQKVFTQPISLADTGFSDLISRNKSGEEKDKGNKRIKW